jgi:hypothetical protein
MPSGHGLPPAELEQRVAVLRRFRELLVQQRDKFHAYMNLLENQRSDIESGDIDALVAHVEIEQGIVAEIFAVQKVIAPLEDMYRAAYAGSVPQGIPQLQKTLETLKDNVIERTAANQALLKQRMDMLRNQIMSINNPYAKRKSVYAQTPESRSLDISG